MLMIWSAVYSLPHSQAAKRAKPYLYIFEQNHPMPVCRRLNLTQADLGTLFPSAVGETSVIYVESCDIIFLLLVSCIIQPVCRTDVKIIASFLQILYAGICGFLDLSRR